MSPQKIHKFKVKISDLSIDWFVPYLPGEDPALAPQKCEPYLKVDFDNYKVFRTDYEQINAWSPKQDPSDQVTGESTPTEGKHVEWGFKAAFQYRTRVAERLMVKTIRVQCFDRRAVSKGGEPHRLIGEVNVDLMSVCTGPSHLDLSLLDKEGNCRGTLHMTCVMKLLCPDFAVTLNSLNLIMQGSPASAQLNVSTSLEESTITHIGHSSSGHWEREGGWVLAHETSLADLLAVPDLEYIKVNVLDSSDIIQGEVNITFRDFFEAVENTQVPFRVPVTYAGGVVGELSGILRFSGFGLYAQMPSGRLYDDLKLSPDSRILFQGLRLPEHFEKQGVQVCSCEATDGLENSVLNPSPLKARQLTPMAFAPSNERPPKISEASLPADWMDKVELPPNWEVRRDRNHNVYFADKRSKRTTWVDPRFLPENWDQRIAAATGQTYFAYHKSRQVTALDPRGCPKGWEPRLSHQGDLYFAFLPVRKTTFTDPRGLPEGVEAALDLRGRVYYRCHSTKSTQWDDPRERLGEEAREDRKAQERQRWWKEQVLHALKDHDETEKVESPAVVRN